MLSKEELGEWKRNPITRAVLEQLDEEATRIASEHCGGATLTRQGVGGCEWSVGALYGIGFINTIEGDEKEKENES